jgi:hypothetical protein
VLFTVTAGFSDFTIAVEQFEAESPDGAARLFVERAVSMAEYDRSQWRIAGPDNITLIHIAGGLRGAWIWAPTPTFKRADNAMLGGVIVQTDPAGPRRPTAA